RVLFRSNEPQEVEWQQTCPMNTLEYNEISYANRENVNDSRHCPIRTWRFMDMDRKAPRRFFVYKSKYFFSFSIHDFYYLEYHSNLAIIFNFEIESINRSIKL